MLDHHVFAAQRTHKQSEKTRYLPRHPAVEHQKHMNGSESECMNSDCAPPRHGSRSTRSVAVRRDQISIVIARSSSDARGERPIPAMNESIASAPRGSRRPALLRASGRRRVATTLFGHHCRDIDFRALTIARPDRPPSSASTSTGPRYAPKQNLCVMTAALRLGLPSTLHRATDLPGFLVPRIT